MYRSLPYSVLVWPMPPFRVPPGFEAPPEPPRSALPAPGSYHSTRKPRRGPPVLRFTATRLSADQGSWTAPGRLEVRGISQPVELRLAPIRRTGDGAVVLRATAEVDRRDFGIDVPRAVINRRARSTSRSPHTPPAGRTPGPPWIITHSGAPSRRVPTPGSGQGRTRHSRR